MLAAAGCYELRAGPWLNPDGTVQTTPGWDVPAFVLPYTIHLYAEKSRVPLFGHLRFAPQPAKGGAFTWASWAGNVDTLVLEWSMPGGFGNPELRVQLIRTVPSYLWYHGRMTGETDARGEPPPYRNVMALPVTCREGVVRKSE
jgi:hypothetical protein